MRRSHPPTLLRLVERCLREECAVVRGDRLLVACSGGPDSMALLHTLAMLRRRLGHELVAHGVDHGLRAAATDELALVAGQAAALAVPFDVTTVQVAPGGNLQERARRARHDALSRAARAAGAAIAVGHTADDRAETVLLRLLRGSGPRGLAVLAARGAGPAGVPVLRPMIRARRSDVTAHLDRHGIPSADDPSNANSRFLRVRVRRELLPLLEQLSPRIVEHLCGLADMLEQPGERADAAERPGGAAGEPEALAGLGRAQRQAIERGRRLGRRSVRIRVRGGEELEVAFRDGTIVLMPHLSGPSPRGSTAGGHGGMLVDSEGKGAPGPAAGQDRQHGQSRSSRRGTS